MTEGAVWFVLLGQCEKLLAGIVSNAPSLIPAPGTCGLMPSDLPFAHVYRYWLSVPSPWSLRLRDLSLAVLGSCWGGWIFWESEAKWGWLMPLWLPHTILSQDWPLRGKKGRSGRTVPGRMGRDRRTDVLGKYSEVIPFLPRQGFLVLCLQRKALRRRIMRIKDSGYTFSSVHCAIGNEVCRIWCKHISFWCVVNASKKKKENLINTPFRSRSTWGNLLVWLYCPREELSLE